MSHKSAPYTAVSTIGIDLGKNSFHLVGLDQRGAIVLQLNCSRAQLERRLANIPSCLIGMEACSGAHYIGRRLSALGHDVRLIPATIAICAPYSSRRPGWCWSRSGQSIGSAMGSSHGSKQRRSDCITTFSPSRSPTSSPALLGASWLIAEPSRPARFRPRNPPRTVETPYLPRSARGFETRWRIGLPGACEHW